MTDDTVVELPKSKRPERKEEVKEERRRRGVQGLERHLRLNVNKDKIDPAYEYRWINDALGRLQAKTTQDDWDRVEDEAPRVVGIGPDGKAMHAYLCRKRKDYYQQDKAEEQAKLKEQEDAVLKHKAAAGQDALNPGAPEAYVPGRR